MRSGTCSADAVVRRLVALATAWLVFAALLAPGTAAAQEEEADGDEAPAEPARYGDAELIEALRSYGFLDEWIAASPVSPEASLLRVAGGGYESQRQSFLSSLESWADLTEPVRKDLARIDAAQATTDRLRTAVLQVRDAMVTDDRLAFESDTLQALDDALGQLAELQIPEHRPGEGDDLLTQAEVRLNGLWELAEAEFQALNGKEPATVTSGIQAFVGFDALSDGLDDVDELIERGRQQIRPARERSEQLASSALAQIADLHAARMLGSSDVDGLSVVTVDAYIRGAARGGCSVDWALLAGISAIESNHGRIGGASVARSGQVSTAILGPLLDGGATEREREEADPTDDQVTTAVDAVEAARLIVRAALERSVWGLFGRVNEVARGQRALEQAVDGGNGFAVVVDSDGGRLDGNDRWDRAVGPMQFLPETWSKWATDGNGDGASDPHNLYDAAATAARFLCDLSATRGPSPSTFVLGYNDSTSYVRSVLSTAARLRSRALPAP